MWLILDEATRKEKELKSNGTVIADLHDVNSFADWQFVPSMLCLQ